MRMEMSQQQKHFWPGWRFLESSQLSQKLKAFQANNFVLWDFSYFLIKTVYISNLSNDWTKQC